MKSLLIQAGWAMPTVAWPTLALTAVCVIVELLTVFMLYQHKLNPLLAVLINIVASFTAFTPMHDASHGSIFMGSHRYLNTLVGLVSSSCFPVPFFAFKHLHLMHHKHTNLPQDPDLWAGSGPSYLLPLRWMSIEFKYYTLYLPKLHTRPLAEAIAAAVQLIILVGIIILLLRGSFGNDAQYAAVWGWLVPGRVAVWLLAFFFDYLPHRPHKIGRFESEFAATAVTSLFANQTHYLTWPLLHQNYHNIHHLAPYVPFYLYSILWNSLKKDLIQRGTKVNPLFPIIPPK